MSGNPLDRIRREAGVAGRLSSDRGGSGPRAHNGGDLAAILAARRGRPADLRQLRAPASIALGLAIATFFGHVRALAWSAELARDHHLFVYRWLVDVLTFGNSSAWAPILAIVAAIVLAGCGLWSRGFRSGQLPVVVGIGVSVAGAGVAALPLVVAAVLALVALVVALALLVAAVVIGALILFALLASL